MRIPSQAIGDQVWGTSPIDNYIQGRNRPKVPRKPKERKGLFATLTDEEASAIALVLPGDATKGYAILWRPKDGGAMTAAWSPNYRGTYRAGSVVRGKITRTVKLTPAMIETIHMAQADSTIP